MLTLGLKCSGERPHCAFCARRGLACVYDVEDGVSRSTFFRESLQRAKSRVSVLRRLKLERRFSKAKSRHDGAEQKRLRRVASKALWGVHCFDRYSKVP